LSDAENDTLAQTTSFGYNALGLLSSIERPNGINTTYSYAAQENPYWLTGIEHYDEQISLPANPLIASYSYSYDLVGNRSNMTETRPSGSLSYDYTYDAANRLISESIDGTTATRSYSYDRAGNRLTSSYLNQTTRYFYNSSDELTQLMTPNNYTQSFEYDEAGNLEYQYGILGISNYSYNAKNQLTNINSNGIPISYAYDHAGHRTKQNVGGSVTNYLWDEFSQYGDVILESNASYQYQRDYTLANGMLVSQNDSLGSLYFLSDAQGSTRALTDTSGAVSSSYSYDAFGNLDGTAQTAQTNYLYTGQQFDPATELYSLRARYYDPSLGRFTSRDIWAYNYQNPVELNRYVYTANNPTRYRDPSGYLVDISSIESNNTVGATVANQPLKDFIFKFGIGMLAGGLGWLAGEFIGGWIFSKLTSNSFQPIDSAEGSCETGSVTVDCNIVPKIGFGANLLWASLLGGMTEVTYGAIDDYAHVIPSNPGTIKLPPWGAKALATILLSSVNTLVKPLIDNLFTVVQYNNIITRTQREAELEAEFYRDALVELASVIMAGIATAVLSIGETSFDDWIRQVLPVANSSKIPGAFTFGTFFLAGLLSETVIKLGELYLDEQTPFNPKL
jgi:RHS repeat-associated protein